MHSCFLPRKWCVTLGRGSVGVTMTTKSYRKLASSSAGDETFLTHAELAQMLRLKPGTLENWAWQKGVPVYHLGRARRYRLSEVEAALFESCSVAQHAHRAQKLRDKNLLRFLPQFLLISMAYILKRLVAWFNASAFLTLALLIAIPQGDVTSSALSVDASAATIIARSR